jgi:putative transposase
VQGVDGAADNPGMTPPRRIVPGRLCFVTARAVGRMFRFVPQREVVRVFEYLFAVAATKYGMQVHELLCMSNHFHVLMTDVEGRLPDFMEYFDSLLARSLNAMRGTSGSVFEKGYGLVEVTDEEKAIEHAVYTLANPCSAHLVRRSKQWPGVSTLRMQYGEAVAIERPKVGLWKRAQAVVERRKRKRRDPKRARHRGKPSVLPDAVELRLVRPAVYPEWSDGELRAEIRRRLDVRELELIEARRERGTEVLGVAKVLAQKWYGFPGRPEDMFGTDPGVSGRSKWARIQALQRREEFEKAHALARSRFLAGIRGVLWPWGTWLMRVRFGLPCETAPP